MALGAGLVRRIKAFLGRGDPIADAAAGRALRDAVAGAGATDAASLAARLATGELTAAQFGAGLYLTTRNAVVSAYAAGRGGAAALTRADTTAIGRILGEQAGFVRGFVADVGNGLLTGEDIAARAALYGNAGIEAFSRGVAAAAGLDLPVHPPRHPNCRCAWEVATEDGATIAYWRTDAGACPVCVGLAAQYGPWRPTP